MTKEEIRTAAIKKLHDRVFQAALLMEQYELRGLMDKGRRLAKAVAANAAQLADDHWKDKR